MEALHTLKKFVSFIHLLNENEWNDFAAIWQPYKAKRKEVLTAAGEIEKYLYFVTEGIQHIYYTTEEGKEVVIVFSYPPSFSGIIDSFLLQQPSKYYLQTLTNSEFIRTSYQQFNALMDRYPNFQKLILKALSITVSGTLERQVELQCFSAEQKFRTLLKRSPHVLNLIPHKYLASYLGIDATTFSKLLGSIKID